MASVELLPRKCFKITLDEGDIIEGQFGTWAIKRFCDKQGYTPQGASDAFKDNVKISDVFELLLAAVENKMLLNKKEFNYTDVNAGDWIDQLGGIYGEQMLKILNHSGSEQTEEEKKTVLQPAVT